MTLLWAFLVIEIIFSVGLISLFIYRGRRIVARNQALLGQKAVRLSADPIFPENLTDLENRFSKLGFSRLGTYVELPSDAPRQPEPPTIATWVYTNEAGDIQLELTSLGETGRVVTLRSSFEDEEGPACLETGYPTGETFQGSHYQLQKVKLSAEDAYTQHQQQGIAMQKQYGSPQRLLDLDDYLAWDESYRQHFYPQKIQVLTRRQILFEAGLTSALFFLSLMPLLILSL